jgi:hypothetical protein
MKDDVFWHFDRPTGGYIEVARKGYWGDIELASNDLLFLAADVVSPTEPTPTETSHACVQSDADVNSVQLTTAELFHHRFGHPGRAPMKFLAAKGLIPKEAAGPLPDHCITCATCKGCSIPRAGILNPATRPLQRLHVDLITSPIHGVNGERYALVITDQYSGYLDVVPMRQKSDSKDAMVERMLFYERQLQPLQVTELMSDHGGEFDNNFLQEYCQSRGIAHCFSPPYTSRSNGRPENSNLHLETVTRILMPDTALPPDLWPEVIRCGAASSPKAHSKSHAYSF